MANPAPPFLLCFRLRILCCYDSQPTYKRKEGSLARMGLPWLQWSFKRRKGDVWTLLHSNREEEEEVGFFMNGEGGFFCREKGEGTTRNDALVMPNQAFSLLFLPKLHVLEWPFHSASRVPKNGGTTTTFRRNPTIHSLRHINSHRRRGPLRRRLDHSSNLLFAIH